MVQIFFSVFATPRDTLRSAANPARIDGISIGMWNAEISRGSGQSLRNAIWLTNGCSRQKTDQRGRQGIRKGAQGRNPSPVPDRPG